MSIQIRLRQFGLSRQIDPGSHSDLYAVCNCPWHVLPEPNNLSEGTKVEASTLRPLRSTYLRNAVQLKIAVRIECACVMAILMMATPVIPGQQNHSAQTRSPARTLWSVRSQNITEELIKDASDLPPSTKALLWARLGELWWREDREKARSWLYKAVAIVEAVPNRED